MTVTKNHNSAKFVEPKEVKDLIKQHNLMSLNDLDYRYLYFKAIKMDKDVEMVVRKPFTGTPQGSNGHAPIPMGQVQERIFHHI